MLPKHSFKVPKSKQSVRCQRTIFSSWYHHYDVQAINQASESNILKYLVEFSTVMARTWRALTISFVSALSLLPSCPRSSHHDSSLSAVPLPSLQSNQIRMVWTSGVWWDPKVFLIIASGFNARGQAVTRMRQAYRSASTHTKRNIESGFREKESSTWSGGVWGSQSVWGSSCSGQKQIWVMDRGRSKCPPPPIGQIVMGNPCVVYCGAEKKSGRSFQTCPLSVVSQRRSFQPRFYPTQLLWGSVKSWE